MVFRKLKLYGKHDMAQWFLSYTACGKIAAVVDELIKSFAFSFLLFAKKKLIHIKAPAH